MNRGPGGVVEPAPAAPRGGRLEWRATSALVAVCVIWGATFTLVKGALEDASALLFLTLRFGVALVALAVAFRQAGSIRPSRLPLKAEPSRGWPCSEVICSRPRACASRHRPAQPS